MSTPFNQSFSREQVIQKLKHFCAYQERCHLEVKEKLCSFGIYGAKNDEIISTLIEENYLNEERFAIQYAGGKFRMKKWGRVKIKHALRLRQVSEYCINKALEQIEDEDYRQVLEKLAEEKWSTLKKEGNRFTKQVKTQGYLMQKGYEADLVKEVTQDFQ